MQQFPSKTKANRFAAASVWKVLSDFSAFAIKYKREYKRAPVLIINNANRLAQKQPGLLDTFQCYAKKATDERTASVVFVSGEGHVPARMTYASEWSRHGHIFKIGDISKEEALQYLKFRKIDEKQAAQVYELVGGRITHLKSIADDIKRHATLEGMCTACYVENRVNFLPPLQRYAGRCSLTLKVNLSPLKFFLDILTTRTERCFYVNF